MKSRKCIVHDHDQFIWAVFRYALIGLTHVVMRLTVPGKRFESLQTVDRGNGWEGNRTDLTGTDNDSQRDRVRESEHSPSKNVHVRLKRRGIQLKRKCPKVLKYIFFIICSLSSDDLIPVEYIV